MNFNSTVQANVIDGITEQDNIADYWRQHFHKILNANVYDKALKADIMGQFENTQHNPDMIVWTNCVFQVIVKLECRKAAGSDRICAKYIKFSNTKIHTLLALCFFLCISHGYLPADVIETTIKNKSGNLSDCNNYRPIALATIVSKLLESVLLMKCNDYLNSCDNQFGFKSSHSTDLCTCIYTLKEYIDYYKNSGTRVLHFFMLVKLSIV